MSNRSNRHFLAAALVGASLLAAAPLQAQTAYPARPIQLVVPFPAGGNTDYVARLLAPVLGQKLGTSIVIENRSGGGTTIGATYVAKSAADGYTLLISSGSTFTSGPVVMPNVSYDPIKSFEPIGMVGGNTLVLVAGKQVPVNTIQELAATTKSQPDAYNYASFGNGSTAHFAGEMLKRATGISMMHVPYKGSAPAMNDLLGGQVQLNIDTVPAALPHIKEGRIKPLVVTSAVRSPQLPDVPTLKEAGFDAAPISTWVAVVAPRGLPADVSTRLQAAFKATMADATVREKLTASGFEIRDGDANAVAKLIADELPRLREVARQANITAE
ncbi:Tricarboxylate transport protein TctC [plant metagenome]|uniref:Tricarboxylate transport protein TctC n=1 Tax=plant metagenome TaxID=1297885 RepID=A0A484RTU4_9ZZZZ